MIINIFSIKKIGTICDKTTEVHKAAPGFKSVHKFILNTNGANECLLDLKKQINTLSSNLNVKALK